MRWCARCRRTASSEGICSQGPCHTHRPHHRRCRFSTTRTQRQGHSHTPLCLVPTHRIWKHYLMLFEQLVAVRGCAWPRGSPAPTLTPGLASLLCGHRSCMLQMIKPLRSTLFRTETLLSETRDEVHRWKQHNRRLENEVARLTQNLDVRAPRQPRLSYVTLTLVPFPTTLVLGDVPSGHGAEGRRFDGPARERAYAQ